ncbi:conserved hypothetical protein [[Clostridium] ultunense Esp]|nr:conserved hypothetical protein [[Clostridium] ultunense Esp]
MEKRYEDVEHYLETLADINIEKIERLKKVNKSCIEFIASQVINVNGDKIYKYSRDQIEWHKGQGIKYFLYLVVRIF